MRMHEESTGFHAQRTSLTFPLHNDDAKLIPERYVAFIMSHTSALTSRQYDNDNE